MAVRTGWALETDARVQIRLWPLTNYDLECCASVSLTVKWANNSPPNPGYGAEVCVCDSCSAAGPLAVGAVGASPVTASQAHIYAAQDCCACCLPGSVGSFCGEASPVIGTRGHRRGAPACPEVTGTTVPE